jgi:hypothetical protein
MRSSDLRGVSLVVVCIGVTVFMSACSEPAGNNEETAGEWVSAGDTAGSQLAAAGCLTPTAGAGFTTMPISPVSRFAVLEFTATASGTELDGVIGLTSGATTGFDRLAMAVRFAPGGVIDVRNGGAYQADSVVPFVAGRAYPIRVVADLTSHTYSVYVQTSSAPSNGVVRIARGYAFRPSQSATTSLDTLTAIVDGAAGSLSVCSVRSSGATGPAFSREGNYAVKALDGDHVLVGDGISSTAKLGPNGEVLGQIPRGGSAAVDEAGNIYLALVANGQVALFSYTPALTLRWSRVEDSPNATAVQSIAANSDGAIVALAGATVRRFPADGSASVQIGQSGTRTAVSRDGFAVVSVFQDNIAIFMHDLSGAIVWQSAFQNTVSLAGVSLDLTDRVVIAGHFSGSINFGGPTLETVFSGESDVNCFTAGFARADGAHAFTERIAAKLITGIAANGPAMVIAAERWITPIFPHLFHLGPDGGVSEGEPYTGFNEQWGRSGGVELGPTGRLYWELSMRWPGPNETPYPYLLAF